MHNDTTENDYLDRLDGIEMTPTMEKALDDVLTLIDTRMRGMRPAERIVLGMKLSTAIGATSLVNALQGHRHLLDAGVEALAEDIADMATATFTALDNGDFTTH